MLCLELSASPPAGPERKRLASHGTLHQAANFSPSFSPGSPRAARAAQAAPSGWELRHATARRQARPSPGGAAAGASEGPWGWVWGAPGREPLPKSF